jgi:hypothetical protein
MLLDPDLELLDVLIRHVIRRLRVGVRIERLQFRDERKRLGSRVAVTVSSMLPPSRVRLGVLGQ